MSFKMIVGLTLLVLGIILLYFGINATDKVGEEITNSVTGHYTNKTMTYIIMGVVLIVIGGAITLFRRRH